VQEDNAGPYAYKHQHRVYDFFCVVTILQMLHMLCLASARLRQARDSFQAYI
jgi:hypothetical protein